MNTLYLAPPIFFAIAFVFSMLGMGGSQLYIPILMWMGMDFKTLSQEQRTAFYNSRRQVQTQPSLVARDEALAQLKPVLADLTTEISMILEMDYTALAR